MSGPPTHCDPHLHPAGVRVAGQAGGNVDVADVLLRLMVVMPERLDGRPLPRVVAITVASDSIGLLLGEPRDDPPTEVEAIDGGLTWIIEPSALGGAAPGDHEVSVPWPLLVPLGQAGPRGPMVMANLEELGAIELAGEPAEVLALAESFAAELAADRFGACPRVMCVNCACQLEVLAGVRVIKSLQEVRARAESHRESVGSVETHQGPLPELRRLRSPRIPRPLVIIDPHGHDREAWTALRAVAGSGLAVVAAVPGPDRDPGAGRSTSGYRWALEVSGQRLRWEPVGVDLRLVASLDRHARPDPPGAVGAAKPGLSGEAANNPSGGSSWRTRPREPSQVASADASVVMAPCPGTGFGWVGEPPDVPMRAAIAGASPGPVEMQVIGVVRAVGAAAPFTSQRALDLACYLAFHRDGATADKLRYWLWRRGEPVSSPKAFANVVSRARVCLGRDAENRPYISHVGADGVYRLSAQVTTDVERFAAWLGLAERVPAPKALECLRAALWLARGAPFEGGSGETFSWADASWRSHVEYLVDSTAHRLADAALELDRLDVARWATLRGLAITPDCDQCYQRRIIAARRSGNLREADLVRRALDRLEREPLPELDGLAAGALEPGPVRR